MYEIKNNSLNAKNKQISMTLLVINFHYFNWTWFL